MSSVYVINKGVSKPIVFKGLKAQYIAYLAVGLVLLLLGFVLGYLLGADLYLLLPMVLGVGTLLFWSVFRLSQRFGEHGLMKFFARRSLPSVLVFRSRKLFTGLVAGHLAVLVYFLFLIG